MGQDWIEATYQGFLNAAEIIMEWILLIVGGIALMCIMPFLWGYMWLYRHFILEEP